jgi:ATP-dependent Clp protease protease subunit
MRTIVFAGEVNNETVGNFLREFTELDSEDGDIEIRVFSGGGDLDGAMAIYDIVRASRNSIRTVALGDVSSAAIIIFQAGDLRVVGRNCAFLFHMPTADAGGNHWQLKAAADELERQWKAYCSVISVRSGKDEADVKSLCTGEKILTAEELVSQDLADEVLE